jgi:hypothetical protein
MKLVHRHENTNDDSPITLISARLPRLLAHTHLFKYSITIGKSTNTNMSGKVTKNPSQCCYGDESISHHYRERSNQDKYCKDNPPHDNHVKRSKIEQAKQDLKDHT